MGLLALMLIRLTPRMQLRLGGRADWRFMLADAEYFRRALALLFAARGYTVRGLQIHHDPLDEAPREVVFALEREGTRYAALCVRWIVPVTSEVVARFVASLAGARADIGIIVTTSIFTDGALERARGLPLELYDREHLQQWIEHAWP